MLELSWKKLPVPTPVVTTPSTTPTAPTPVPRSRSSTLSSSKLDEELALDLEGELVSMFNTQLIRHPRDTVGEIIPCLIILILSGEQWLCNQLYSHYPVSLYSIWCIVLFIFKEKHDLEHDEDDEALLLGDDLDEEEEDEEDRSWRR